MADKRIVYTNPSTSNVVVVNPTAARLEGESDDDYANRVADLVVPNGVAHSVVNFDSLPADRNFRNDWAISGGSVSVDMAAARTTHMNNIRTARNKKLEELDVTFMRAVEAADSDAQASAATAKQALRDIPATFDLSGFDNSADLYAAWPDGLPRPAEG
jgi:hypothetical protein|tara:strand:+ start:1462 stop:1938 length:477 start_codon:yes stop_codon:yes gene_type:complete